jgi:phosphoglycerol transferase MdoB-like AlkP superfamily enzyme
VADENLFELALREIDSEAASHPVFSHIMTTSNHRPYTYPEGKIDILLLIQELLWMNRNIFAHILSRWNCT